MCANPKVERSSLFFFVVLLSLATDGACDGSVAWRAEWRVLRYADGTIELWWAELNKWWLSLPAALLSICIVCACYRARSRDMKVLLAVYGANGGARVRPSMEVSSDIRQYRRYRTRTSLITHPALTPSSVVAPRPSDFTTSASLV